MNPAFCTFAMLSFEWIVSILSTCTQLSPNSAMRSKADSLQLLAAYIAEQQLLQLWPELDEDSQRCIWRLRMGLNMAGVSLLCSYQSVWSIRRHMAQHTRSASSLLHICQPSSMPGRLLFHTCYGLFLRCAAFCIIVAAFM
jgi:hypothetical protein